MLCDLQERFNYIDSRNEHCDLCHTAKQRKLSFQNSESCTVKCFDMLHIDIRGPSLVPSLHDHCYFLTIVDDFNMFTWIYFIHNKSETKKHFMDFLNLIENQFKSKVKIITSDNGNCTIPRWSGSTWLTTRSEPPTTSPIIK